MTAACPEARWLILEGSAMPKPKWNLNAIYISECLQESLRPISHCTLTTVIAPMGYGKTTAMNWYLEERAKAEPLRVIRIALTNLYLTHSIFRRISEPLDALTAGVARIRDGDLDAPIAYTSP